MYYQYFGLTEAPFSIAVNPRYLFMSARHRDALAHLLYGVGAGGGFILLTGEVGTGKTTINRCLLEQLPQNTDIAIILNPALNAQELLASACDELGIDYNTDNHTLKTLTDNLHTYLLDNHARGRKTVLLIDEAQHLDFDVLEQIRLLTNLETNSEKLLQIILIGQPELSEMLARPELRQLNQRITARYNLEALNLDETGAYIHHRLQVAGMSPGREIFPPRVVRGIYKVTGGIPRVINVLCDRILLGAYGRNQSRADLAMLNTASREVLGHGLAQKSNRVLFWLLGLVGVAIVLFAVWWWRGEGIGQAGVDKERIAPAASGSGTATSTAGVAPELVATQMGPPGTSADATLEQESEPKPLLPPGAAMAKVWSLYLDAEPPAAICSRAVFRGVACVETQAKTWDELAGFNRPLVLDIVTADRFSAEVLLLKIEGSRAWVYTQEGESAVSLAELAPLWTGTYRFLWHPPTGFTQPLAGDDDSPVVAAVAQLFARLDGQEKPLAGTLFNTQLLQRVRLFQREHGLADDGVVGMRTLLKLNEQLGIDATGTQARALLQPMSAGPKS